MLIFWVHSAIGCPSKLHTKKNSSSIESLMLANIIDSVGEENQNLLIVSMLAAFANTVVQLNKMILEARQLDEDILDYL